MTITSPQSDRSTLVIGTSNSIVKGGWYDGFVNAYSGAVVRMALGGAPFTQFLGKIRDIPPDKFENIIVDTSPNDESYSVHVGTRWMFEKLYVEFVEALAYRTKSVIVIRIPPEPFLGIENGISLLQKEICAKVGATYLDLSSWLKDESPDLKIYRDTYHPQTAVMSRIGHLIASQVALSERSWSVNSGCLAEFPYFEEQAAGDGLDVETVETSLLMSKFLIVPMDKTVKLPSYRLCFGFFVNSGKTNGIIRLHSVDRDRDIACYFENDGRSQITFVPIKGGFVTNALSVIRPWRASESALHGRVDKGPYIVSVGPFLCHDGI